MKKSLFSFILITCIPLSLIAQKSWAPVPGKIMTKWVQDLNPEDPLSEYPRPQLRRQTWQSLNGLWEYAIQPANQPSPELYEGNILVPYPVESALSGVQKRIDSGQELWYQRTFTTPDNWKGDRILLHFGAVDWEAEVWINGQNVGSHQGGYDPFSFDITGVLVEGAQKIQVRVWDPSSEGTQARGKQVSNPRGIWYTPVSGIWQSVWIEPVPIHFVESLKITPDIDQSAVFVQVNANLPLLQNQSVVLTASNGAGKSFSAKGMAGQVLKIEIPDAQLWSPDTPFLYDLSVKMSSLAGTEDQVQGYFGMRKIHIEKDENGFFRFMLNNQYIFPYGTLDQGWWPDGLYTAPTDEALKSDIISTKASGFNTIRKHVKVEPARWYYHCDKLGILVWQDMPNGDKSANWRGPSGYDGQEMKREPQSKQQFYREWKAIMDANINKPSIMMWVPFNEGWGQFETEKVINWTMDYDTTRLVNGPSGGNFYPVGHTVDYHRYPGPGMPDLSEHAPNIMQGRAWLLGEFGGLGLPLEGHLWQQDKNWGYRKYGSSDELVKNYAALIENLIPLIRKGIAAAIYTQTTDVEGEINGLMTYDRALIKMGAERLNEINQKLYDPAHKN